MQELKDKSIRDILLEFPKLFDEEYYKELLSALSLHLQKGQFRLKYTHRDYVIYGARLENDISSIGWGATEYTPDEPDSEYVYLDFSYFHYPPDEN